MFVCVCARAFECVLRKTHITSLVREARLGKKEKEKTKKREG
jgi:hypothetical protein